MTRLGPAVLLACAAVPGLAAGPFDGVYQGPWHVVLSNNTAACGRAEIARAQLTVRDGRFAVRWGGELVHGTVAPDGAVEAGTVQADHYTYNHAGRSAVFHLRGRIADGMLEAEGGGPACQIQVSMRRV
jgi:hypothetical protein